MSIDLARRHASRPGHHAQAREVALLRGAQVLAVRETGVPVAFARLARHGAGAEIARIHH